VLIIVDEIQVGCGRTGSFFSFESIELHPDIIVQSKSLSGMGLPMAILLFKPNLDIWEPAEHNGTFRGNNHAFVTSQVMLEKFWHKDSTFETDVSQKGNYIEAKLADIIEGTEFTLKGRGAMLGIDCIEKDTASAIQKHCFDNRLLIETCGNDQQILKVLCPLTIEYPVLDQGLEALGNAIAAN